jgi:phage I-like protein
MTDALVIICKEVAGEAPAEIQVIPYGVMIETPKGPFTMDAEAARLVTAEYAAHKSDMVIDYEHQTFADPPVRAPAAGWITALIDKGKDGIWAVTEWTDRAREYVANREYRYVSPVFMIRKTDHRVIRLVNVALTNQPNIDGMEPLLNKAAFNADKPEEDVMDKELLTALGLADGATTQDAIAAINKLKGPPPTVVANKTVLGALGLPDGATEAEVTGTIMAMKQGSTQVTELSATVNALSGKLAARDAADLVALAMKEGKITPAQKEWADAYAAADAEGFKVFVAKAPVVFVQGRIADEQKKDEAGLDDAQAMINKMCGVDDETYKKFGPKEQ